MKWLQVIAYLGLFAIIILSLGRFLGLPVFIALVASGSMIPALQPLDMVVAAREDYGVGDIVIWCSTPMYCVIHRVVEIRNDVVITRGDANPAPDPPIRPSLVRGVAILVIPRFVWIPLLISSLALYAVLEIHRGRLRIPRPPRGPVITYTIVILYSVSVFLLALTSPISPVLFVGLSIPSAEVVRIGFDNGSGSIVIIYNLSDLEIRSINSCTLITMNTSINCPSHFSGNSVWVEIPGEVLRKMNLDGVSMINVGLNISLSKNASLLTYLYPVYISSVRPVINITKGVVTIHNPNPFCLDTNITILWANAIGPWNTSSSSRCIEPRETVKLDLGVYRYAYIRIEYIINGKTLIEQREVMRDGRPSS
ncbi:MAG: signal peptidase I [Sulfolobales archaeon]